MIGSMLGERAIAIVRADVARQQAEAARDTRTVWQSAGSKLAASVNTAITSTAVRGGGVQQNVPKKAASSVSPAIIVGGLAAVGLVAFLVVRKMKKKS